MTPDLEDRLAGALRSRLDQLPVGAADERDVRRRTARQRRNRRGGAVAGVLCIVAAAVGLARQLPADGTGSVSVADDAEARPVEDRDLVDLVVAELGVKVTYPAGWTVTDAADCPEPDTVMVQTEPGSKPFWSTMTERGCAIGTGSWVVVEPVPEDLDGYDHACGPGFFGGEDGPPFSVCTLTVKGSPTEIDIIEGVAVVATIHRSGADASGVWVGVSDPADAIGEGDGDARSSVAFDAAQALLSGDCVMTDPSALPGADPRTVPLCRTVPLPDGSALAEMARAGMGGAVSPAAYDARYDTPDGRVAVRFVVGQRWSPDDRRVVPVLGDLAVLDEGVDAACWSGGDDRFAAMPCVPRFDPGADCTGTERRGMATPEAFAGAAGVGYFSPCEEAGARPQRSVQAWARINVYADRTGDDVIAWWYIDCGLPEGVVAVGAERPSSCGGTSTTAVGS